MRSALVSVLIIVAAPSRADDTVPVRIELEAHDGCPNAVEFFARIHARTSRLRLAGDDEAARTIRATVKRTGKLSEGTLEIEDEDARTISGTTCAEVIDAMALVAALYGNEATAPPAEEPKQTPPAPVVDEAPPPKAVAPATPSPPVHAVIGIGVDALALQARGTRFGPTAFVDLVLGAPSLRLSFTRVVSDELVTDVGSAKLTWTWARLDACPWNAHAGRFELRPCAHVSGGFVDARVTIAKPAPSREPWLAAGVHARVTALQLAPVLLEARLGVSFPFVRHDFVFDPETPVHRAPIAVIEAGIAGAVSFL